jgi:hypothetical protein
VTLVGGTVLLLVLLTAGLSAPLFAGGGPMPTGTAVAATAVAARGPAARSAIAGDRTLTLVNRTRETALNTTHAARATGPLLRDGAVVLIFALLIAPVGGWLWRRRE